MEGYYKEWAYQTRTTYAETICVLCPSQSTLQLGAVTRITYKDYIYGLYVFVLIFKCLTS